jgi:hypothetical protein
MRRTLATIVAAAALLALPTAAQATSIHNYSVRDAGTRIVHKITFCSKENWWWDVTMQLESEDGSDRQKWDSDWDDRTNRLCNRVRFWHRDELEYEGPYYARMRVSLPGVGWVRYTGWREFWSS